MSDSFARRLADVGRHWATIETVADTARESAEFAVTTIVGCDAASVGFVRGDRVTTVACTDESIQLSGDWQHRLGGGPSIEAVESARLVRSSDLVSEQRWDSWRRRVISETGFRSVVSVPLFTEQRAFGVVDVYGKEPDGLEAQAVEEIELLAAHLSVHLATTDLLQNLSTALSTRTVIGQAEGIMMERYQLDAVRAFAMLRRVSQDTNTRLAQVAEELVRTRRTPGAEG